MAHLNDTDTQASSVGDVMQALYAAKLHQPAVWQDLQLSYKQLQRPFFITVALVLALLLLAAVLWFLGFRMVAVGLVVAVLFFAFRLRGARYAKLRRLHYLLKPQGVLFSSVAINKIVLEASDRSPEVADYIAKVNAGGRYVFGGFEIKQFLRVLALLDAFEREQNVC